MVVYLLEARRGLFKVCGWGDPLSNLPSTSARFSCKTRWGWSFFQLVSFLDFEIPSTTWKTHYFLVKRESGSPPQSLFVFPSCCFDPLLSDHPLLTSIQPLVVFLYSTEPFTLYHTQYQIIHHVFEANQQGKKHGIIWLAAGAIDWKVFGRSRSSLSRPRFKK